MKDKDKDWAWVNQPGKAGVRVRARCSHDSEVREKEYDELFCTKCGAEEEVFHGGCYCVASATEESEEWSWKDCGFCGETFRFPCGGCICGKNAAN